MKPKTQSTPVSLRLIDAFTRGYLICALWSSTDNEGEPLDREKSLSDISAETLAESVRECVDFQEGNAEDLELYCAQYRPSGDFTPSECAGHDFWLTRNGHGAGFWDRGLGELGKRLSDAAKVYGGVDLYVGDDGEIHGS